MEKYVALLRGINVSGQKTILMADLQRLCGKIGFRGAKTYIQSGNVVFASPKRDPRKLAGTLEAALSKEYGFDVTVIVRAVPELARIVAANPFAGITTGAGDRVYISFLAQAPDREAAQKLARFPRQTDEFRLANAEVYILCRNGFGKTVFSNNFMEKALGVRATTRNLQTSEKLVSLGTEE